MTEVDNSPVDEAVAQFKDAIANLPAAERETQRLNFLSMLDESPGNLFFIRMELSGTGPTHNIKRSVMYPSEFYLGWIAALRAGNLNWDIELTGE